MSSTLLKTTVLSFSQTKRMILDAISIELYKGELIGLIGPNGAGKSTLLKILAHLLKPDSGQVFWKNKELSTLKANERAKALAWLEQNGAIHWPLTVERLVALGRLPHLAAWQKLTEADQQVVDQVLIETDLAALRGRDATTLSGGERSRVLLARALASEPQVLLADEPIAALDLGHQLQTMQLLREFAQGERASVVVLHDLALAARYCDRLYLMQHGKIVATGKPEQVLTPELLAQVYGVECVLGATPYPWLVPVRRLGAI
ncbi:ABC transporter ATP-binding protein [Thiofilum flexile]|uniref:ABC transporter ATP-binding protein n=1 Tax=Thiofilum flexile TaxID=125627 RepID=UPI000368A3E1|nr:ABC transporter ATP-binding protein [Thiofilum flexile]